MPKSLLQAVEKRIMVEVISQEDVNRKFLKSLSPEWTHIPLCAVTNEAVKYAHAVPTARLQVLLLKLKIIVQLECMLISVAFFVKLRLVKQSRKAVRKNNGALIIEDWVSDSEEEDVPQAKLKKKTVASKSIDGLVNISYLTDFEEIDGGYVAFRGNPKEEITSKVPGNIISATIMGMMITFSQSSKSYQMDGSKPSSDDGKKVDEDPRKDSECNDQENEDNVNSTNNVNDASTNEVNVVGCTKK
ncbi:hypothetical protein Tco_1183387 [Tanacetum coccineum]